MITKEQALKCMTTVEHMRHHTAAFSNASEKLRQFIEQQPDIKPSAHGLEGWKEAAIAWAVCASIHREYCTGKDPFFTTRQADFVRHENDARAMLNQFSQENKSQEG